MAKRSSLNLCERAAFTVCFAQTDVRLITRFSLFSSLLTVLDCLCASVRLRDALLSGSNSVSSLKQIAREKGKTFDLMPLPTQNCLPVTLNLFSSHHKQLSPASCKTMVPNLFLSDAPCSPIRWAQDPLHQHQPLCSKYVLMKLVVVYDFVI